ncbi:hypothetical protein C2E21_9304 [Chlorella sorokiniana]|uniref:Uncharacterized protein n=1 Tax=Chlorella sorokiniana TaxID=3076 RepID=A0A2P6TBW0_CHLSO|nr:hypothetical protein C2E21_9304 [Chlorella sorokiniana]|eukprot:PRW18378.1 hypothetical protein C2E21_9304 [Chlorella sorokiniana]
MALSQAAARPSAARADTARSGAASCRPQQRARASRRCEKAAERRGRRLNAVETAAAEAAAAAAEATTAPPADTWAAFAAAVSGEWEGVTASFGPDGSPVQLPEYYVPQAYRDWGVELFDWQSQSSMLAEEGGLTATDRRMMPTVGCEADAIAYTQDARQLFSTGPAGPPPAVAPDGSYSTGPSDVSAAECHKAAFESCLMLPCQPGAQQHRLRLVHSLARLGAESRWQLQEVELHSERYDSPYRGKLELSGCGGGMKGFATSEPLSADALAGAWVASGVRYTAEPSSSSSDGVSLRAEAVAGEAWSAQDLQPLLLHPLRAWSCCRTAGEGGNDISLAAGVLLNEGGSSMALVTRRLVGGRLAAVELLTLIRA